MRVDGERVVVFGGSSGVGVACARAFVEQGGDVVLAARDEARLQTSADMLGGATAAVSVDVADETAVRALFDRVDEVRPAVVSAAPTAAVGRRIDIGAGAVGSSVTTKAVGQATATLAAARRVVRGGSVTVISGVGGRPRAARMGAVGMADAAPDAMVPVLAASGFATGAVVTVDGGSGLV